MLGKAQGESIRERMYPNTRETKLEMEGLLKAKNRIKRQELESGQKLGTGSIGTHHGKTELSCSLVEGQSLGAVSQIGGEKSNGFEGLAHQLVGPAQTDEMPKVHHDLLEFFLPHAYLELLLFSPP